ncbi:MAG: hypothetical protein ACT4QD_06855 [Acidobacteriota bacterium]
MRKRRAKQLVAGVRLYIGAHPAVAGHTLLTRDPRRYQFYFPTLRLVSP